MKLEMLVNIAYENPDLAWSTVASAINNELGVALQFKTRGRSLVENKLYFLAAVALYGEVVRVVNLNCRKLKIMGASDDESISLISSWLDELIPRLGILADDDALGNLSCRAAIWLYGKYLESENTVPLPKQMPR